MNQSYDILFTVSFAHDYFSNGKTNAFTVAPTAATVEYMKREGLMYKLQPDGFALSFDRWQAGTERKKEDVLAAGKSVLFYMICKDNSLFSYTDLPVSYQPGKSSFYFTNREDSGDSRLQVKETVTGEDIHDNNHILPKPSFSQPFGYIQIDFGGIKKDEYTIRFGVKATYWRYLLVSDFVKELQQPAVIDKENTVVFSGPSPVMLPDKKEAISFVSQSRLPMSQKPDRSFRLVENYNGENTRYKMVLQRLPYPDASHFSVISAATGDADPSQYSNVII